MGFTGGMEGACRGSIPIPEELWNTIPAPARAALLVWAAELQRRVEQAEARAEKAEARAEKAEALVKVLEARVADLEAEVARLRGRGGGGSHGTKASGGPNVKPSPPKPKSGKKRGAQAGHRRKTRPLVPPEKVAQAFDHHPANCRGCGADLHGDDPEPIRHQVADIPPIEPTVIEHRLHQLKCQGCGKTTRAKLPTGVPTSQFGPRLTAILSLLRCDYHVGIRPIQRLCLDAFGLSISVGAICGISERTAAVLEQPYNELLEQARTEPANIDETTWRENRGRAVLWTMVTATLTVFHIAATKGAKVLRELLGEGYSNIVMCDRAKAYRRVAKLQWCWAHLRRDFQAMISRSGPSEKIGKELLAISTAMFEWWHRMRDGKITAATMRREIHALKPFFKAELEAGRDCGCAKTAATCRDLLDNWPNLWRFVSKAGVNPTNNAAEQAHRPAVIWRKSCYGSDSPKGSRFVERLLSVATTCRRRSVNVLEYLTTCHAARLHGQPIPPVPNPSPLANKPLAA